jgi:hypothetical protein
MELNIRFLKEAVDETLLTKVLSANNGRLESVSFDQNSAFLDVPIIDQTISYLNIQKLAVNIKQCRMLPYIFALVPYVHCLYINIEERSYKPNFKQALVNLSPLNHLIDFHLCSIDIFWNLDAIDAVLRQMPSLQTLTLELCTEDKSLIKQENFVKILPAYLKQVHFLIYYYFSEPFFEVTSLATSWSLVLPISCLLDEINECVLMFTTSFRPRLLNLPAVIGKQIVRGSEYTQQVEDLYVFNSTSLADILLTMQHFHRLRKLCINAKRIEETCKYFSSIILGFSLILAAYVLKVLPKTFEKRDQLYY